MVKSYKSVAYIQVIIKPNPSVEFYLFYIKNLFQKMNYTTLKIQYSGKMKKGRPGKKLIRLSTSIRSNIYSGVTIHVYV